MALERLAGNLMKHTGIYLFILALVIIFLGFVVFFFKKIWPDRLANDSWLAKYIDKTKTGPEK